MTREFLKILNDENKNVYNSATLEAIGRRTRVECDDFLQYKPFFNDLNKMTTFLNSNLSIKKKFLAEMKKADPRSQEDYTVTEYMETFKRSIDNLTDFSKLFKKAEIDKVNEIVDRPLDFGPNRNPRYNRGGANDPLFDNGPREDQPLFTIGDRTKAAEPYWRIN